MTLCFRRVITYIHTYFGISTIICITTFSETGIPALFTTGLHAWPCFYLNINMHSYGQLAGNLLGYSEFSIHALVKVLTPSHTFMLTTIHASPSFNKRKPLWQYLKILAPLVNVPWVLLGDFNEMPEEDEKNGGFTFKLK